MDEFSSDQTREANRSEPHTVVPVTLTITSVGSVMSGISTSSIFTLVLPCLDGPMSAEAE
jgi:hypothetical protein